MFDEDGVSRQKLLDILYLVDDLRANENGGTRAGKIDGCEDGVGRFGSMERPCDRAKDEERQEDADDGGDKRAVGVDAE